MPNPELTDMTRRFWIGLALTAAGRCVSNGRPHRPACAPLVPRRHLAPGCNSRWRRRWCCGPAGRSLSAAGARSSPRQSQHVHADRHGHRRRLRLQRRRPLLAPGLFPAAFREHGRQRRSISRPPPSSPCWCCSARCWNCGRATTTGRRDPRAARPRAQDRAAPDGRRRATRTFRSNAVARRRPPARASGREDSGRRRACSRAAARSTNRWSPANPMPVDKEPERTRSSAARSTARAASSCAPTKSARDTLLARIVQMVAEAQRSRAPIQRLADTVAGWFVPAVIAVARRAFAAWALVGPRAALRLRAGRRGRGADHRLPVRARAGHADVDHGRRRPRRAARRPGQERRGAGADGEDRHAGRSTRPAR